LRHPDPVADDFTAGPWPIHSIELLVHIVDTHLYIWQRKRGTPEYYFRKYTETQPVRMKYPFAHQPQK
jgi:hypothetical protein